MVTTLDLLAGLGNLVDLPSSMVRDLTAGQNPLDNLLRPFSHENRLSGRDWLRHYGMAGPEDNWGNFGAGVLMEELVDPINWFTLGGAGLLRRGLKAGDAALAAKSARLGPNYPTRPDQLVGYPEPSGMGLPDWVRKGWNDYRIEAPSRTVTADAAERIPIDMERELGLLSESLKKYAPEDFTATPETMREYIEPLAQKIEAGDFSWTHRDQTALESIEDTLGDAMKDILPGEGRYPEYVAKTHADITRQLSAHYTAKEFPHEWVKSAIETMQSDVAADLRRGGPGADPARRARMWRDTLESSSRLAPYTIAPEKIDYWYDRLKDLDLEGPEIKELLKRDAFRIPAGTASRWSKQYYPSLRENVRKELEDSFRASVGPGGPINPKTERPFHRDTKAFQEWLSKQDENVLRSNRELDDLVQQSQKELDYYTDKLTKRLDEPLRRGHVEGGLYLEQGSLGPTWEMMPTVARRRATREATAKAILRELEPGSRLVEVTPENTLVFRSADGQRATIVRPNVARHYNAPSEFRSRSPLLVPPTRTAGMVETTTGTALDPNLQVQHMPWVEAEAYITAQPKVPYGVEADVGVLHNWDDVFAEGMQNQLQEELMPMDAMRLREIEQGLVPAESAFPRVTPEEALEPFSLHTAMQRYAEAPDEWQQTTRPNLPAIYRQIEEQARSQPVPEEPLYLIEQQLMGPHPRDPEFPHIPRDPRDPLDLSLEGWARRNLPADDPLLRQLNDLLGEAEMRRGRLAGVQGTLRDIGGAMPEPYLVEDGLRGELGAYAASQLGDEWFRQVTPATREILREGPDNNQMLEMAADEANMDPRELYDHLIDEWVDDAEFFDNNNVEWHLEWHEGDLHAVPQNAMIEGAELQPDLQRLMGEYAPAGSAYRDWTEGRPNRYIEEPQDAIGYGIREQDLPAAEARFLQYNREPTKIIVDPATVFEGGQRNPFWREFNEEGDVQLSQDLLEMVDPHGLVPTGASGLRFYAGASPEGPFVPVPTVNEFSALATGGRGAAHPRNMQWPEAGLVGMDMAQEMGAAGLTELGTAARARQLLNQLAEASDVGLGLRRSDETLPVSQFEAPTRSPVLWEQHLDVLDDRTPPIGIGVDPTGQARLLSGGEVTPKESALGKVLGEIVKTMRVEHGWQGTGEFVGRPFMTQAEQGLRELSERDLRELAQAAMFLHYRAGDLKDASRVQGFYSEQPIREMAEDLTEIANEYVFPEMTYLNPSAREGARLQDYLLEALGYNLEQRALSQGFDPRLAGVAGYGPPEMMMDIQKAQALREMIQRYGPWVPAAATLPAKPLARQQ